jgi:hypothetical protein
MAANKKTPVKKPRAKKKLSAKTLSLRKAQVFIELMGGADQARKAIDAVEAAENAAKKNAKAKTLTVKKAARKKVAEETATAIATANEEQLQSSGMLTHAQVCAHAALLTRMAFPPSGWPGGTGHITAAGFPPSGFPGGRKKKSNRNR